MPPRPALLLALLLAGPPAAPAADLPRYVPTTAELQAGYQRALPGGQPRPRVYKDRVTPHWFAGGTKLWYRNDLKGGTKEFVLADAAAGTRGPAFDHAKLAAALSKAADKQYAADRLPFDAVDFADDAKSVQFRVGEKGWACDLANYVVTPAVIAAEPVAAQPPARRQRDRTAKSPDGKFTAAVTDGNVVLRDADGKETRLTTDAGDGRAYAFLSWSPDSRTLAAFRVTPGDDKPVHLVESSPKAGGRAVLRSRPYPLPGDKLAAFEPHLFDAAAGKEIPTQAPAVDLGGPDFHWAKDGKTFHYTKADRGHQRFRVIAVDARTGDSRALLDEKSDTFIWTAHAEDVGVRPVTWLDQSGELIHCTEKSGWRHLVLVDAATGAVKNSITSGAWVVRGVDLVDEAKRQVWFRAGGVTPGQDPYFVHHYRVNFDGTGLVALTAGDGTHTVQYSPGREYLVDTHSRVDSPPVHELRRCADGALVCKLDAADATELAAGPALPEVFTAKGRDGVTDIWGVICRPRGFDPAKRYPVVEQIYAGPQGSFVPKAFGAAGRYAALTELGFVVVQIDGMGTANRSKAFHDVCWKNLKDGGFPDRVLWHKAAAAKYPWYDATRVGVTGGSAGGQNAAGGVLFHPDFYTAAVAACGCHDNRMDKASWNEQWMGYPVGPQYAASSNIDNAHRLQGKLLLIVGELDTNVPPESTYRLADALIKAGKDFDFLMVPGGGHGDGGAYGTRRRQDFFVRHLHGVEPPGRNAPAPAPAKPAAPAVTAPPAAFFDKYPEADRAAARGFYAKHLDVQGVSVAAAGVVADEALTRAAGIVTGMLAGRPDVLKTMADAGTRLVVIGKSQVYTDMPEYRASRNPDYLNERVRGTGGLRVTSFGEESLLGLAEDRYDDESIAVHEFCHTVDAALRKLDPAWRQRLDGAYRSALDRGLWRDTYAASNPAEYWAEVAQCYFDCNRVNNWNHGPVGTREQLKQYDPAGYELARTTFKLPPAADWRYARPLAQPSVGRPPAKLKCDPFYAKHSYAREFPVLGSARVSDAALLAANDSVRKLFAYRHDILKAILADGGRLVILARGETLADLPELRTRRAAAGADNARTLDYAPDLKLMVVPEENVLRLPGDPLGGRCGVVAAFARALYVVTATRPADPAFDARRDKQQYELRVTRLDESFDAKLKELAASAAAKGLWTGTAAGRDRAEYWAAGVEAYFDAGGGPAPARADHPVVTRDRLRQYDPDLFRLVEETMAYKGRPDWRARR